MKMQMAYSIPGAVLFTVLFDIIIINGEYNYSIFILPEVKCNISNEHKNSKHY